MINPAFEQDPIAGTDPKAKIINLETEEFKKIQENYLRVYNKRVLFLDKLRHGKAEEKRKTLEMMKVYYKWNPINFIEDWVTTYDPRLDTPFMPFLLFPRQKEFINWIIRLFRGKSDGLVEKCRDMGLTWLCVSISVWFWLFWGGMSISFGSRKEALVDKMGDPDSILEKVRIVLRNLPTELLPLYYKEDKHAGFLKIMNPENKAIITGEAGDNIGRGGRSSLYFKDESAFYNRPKLIEAALSQNSNCKIDISTPNGIGNPFYQKRMGGKVPVFIFDWREDPRKSEEWYQKQKNELDAIIVAQEIDRDYSASVEGVLIPSIYVKAAIGLKLEKEGDKYGSFDVANEGGDLNTVGFRQGPVVEIVKGWKEGNTTDNTNEVYTMASEYGCRICGYDSDGVGAGVKGEASRIATKEETEHGSQLFHFVGIASGGKVSPGWFSSDRRKKDVYANHKAENGWQLRQRFEKTWKYVNGIAVYPHSEMISLPEINDENKKHIEQLITELSLMTYSRSENGKITLISKKELKKNGIKSPDYFDMLSNLFSSKLYTVNFEDIEVGAELVSSSTSFDFNGATGGTMDMDF